MQNALEKYIKLHKFYSGGFDYQTKELAKYLCVTTRTIQRWMKRKTGPNNEQLKRIEEYLVGKEAISKKG